MPLAPLPLADRQRGRLDLRVTSCSQFTVYGPASPSVRADVHCARSLVRVSRAFRDRVANAVTPAPIGLHAGRPRAMPIFPGA